MRVKHLLYAEKYTIDGARQKVDDQRRGGALRGAARAALDIEIIESVEEELKAVLATLEGKGGATR